MDQYLSDSQAPVRALTSPRVTETGMKNINADECARHGSPTCPQSSVRVYNCVNGTLAE